MRFIWGLQTQVDEIELQQKPRHADTPKHAESGWAALGGFDLQCQSESPGELPSLRSEGSADFQVAAPSKHGGPCIVRCTISTCADTFVARYYQTPVEYSDRWREDKGCCSCWGIWTGKRQYMSMSSRQSALEALLWIVSLP